MVIIGIGLNLGMYIYIKIAQYRAKIVFDEVKKHDKLFVYETYYHALNAALYVKDLEDTAELIDYYTKVEKHDTTAYFNFEIKMMRITMYKPRRQNLLMYLIIKI
jgi:hypothetical protein